MEEEPDWILVGVIKGSHGTAGEVLVESLTDNRRRFSAGSELNICGRDEEKPRKVKIIAGRTAAKGILVRLEGCSSREEAKELAGSRLFIRSSELLPPDEGSYYDFQIEGCEVFEGKRLIGEVTALVESKANPFLEVEEERGGLINIPFVKAVVVEVDVEKKRIEIIDGFLG